MWKYQRYDVYFMETELLLNFGGAIRYRASTIAYAEDAVVNNANANPVSTVQREHIAENGI